MCPVSSSNYDTRGNIYLLHHVHKLFDIRRLYASLSYRKSCVTRCYFELRLLRYWQFNGWLFPCAFSEVVGNILIRKIDITRVFCAQTTWLRPLFDKMRLKTDLRGVNERYVIFSKGWAELWDPFLVLSAAGYAFEILWLYE